MSVASILAQIVSQLGGIAPPYVKLDIQTRMATMLYQSLQVGEVNGSTPAVGEIGETLVSTRLVAARVTGMVSGTVYDVNTLTITPGRWLIMCNTMAGEAPAPVFIETVLGAGANAAAVFGARQEGLNGFGVVHPGTTAAGFAAQVVCLPYAISVSSSTIYRQVARGTFASGTLGVWGNMRAIRI